MTRHLIVTTSADTSADAFRPFADIIFVDRLEAPIAEKQYETFYIRSQFHDESFMPQRFSKEIDAISKGLVEGGTRAIDNMSTVNQIINFEDKWLQYDMYSSLMPDTWLAVKVDNCSDLIYKKRLSSRGAGIAWKKDDIGEQTEDWIAQVRLDIVEELRAYVIKGSVFPIASIKQSKRPNVSVKVQNTRRLSLGELSFAESVHKLAPNLEFIGIDMAITQDGIRLIEVNRSPIFNSFTRLCGKNLAEKLYTKPTEV